MLYRFSITPQQNNTTCNIYYSVRSLVKLDLITSTLPRVQTQIIETINRLASWCYDPKSLWWTSLSQIWMLLHTSLFLNDGTKLWPEYYNIYMSYYIMMFVSFGNNFFGF